MYQFIALFVFSLMSYSYAHSTGAPNETYVCKYMVPGHNVSATTDPPAPFTFKLNATEYSPGDVIEVFLNSSGDWFMEGLLVQARTVDCQGETTSVGKFSVQENDVFLAPLDCFGKTASALTHYSHFHIYNRTFYWTAPTPAVGHVFLKATIVRRKKTFWLNVHSPYIYDSSNSTRSGLTKDATCGADINRVTMALFCGISLIFLLFKN